MNKKKYIYTKKTRSFQKRYAPFMVSLFIHLLLFIPPIQVSFHKFFNKPSLPPPAAVIQFRFFAPVPQKKAEPQKAKVIKQDKDALPREKPKDFPDEQRELKDLIESVKSRRKSTALKTIAPLKEVDKEKIKWDYALFVQKTIQRHLVYPASEKSRGIEESVRVTFCIDKNGRLVGRPDIPEMYLSRYTSFNLEAVQAVIKASSSFPPLPEEIEKDRQYFDIVIEFRE